MSYVAIMRDGVELPIEADACELECGFFVFYQRTRTTYQECRDVTTGIWPFRRTTRSCRDITNVSRNWLMHLNKRDVRALGPASADTRPEGGDATEIAAPFTSGAVPKADAKRNPS